MLSPSLRLSLRGLPASLSDRVCAAQGNRAIFGLRISTEQQLASVERKNEWLRRRVMDLENALEAAGRPVSEEALPHAVRDFPRQLREADTSCYADGGLDWLFGLSLLCRDPGSTNRATAISPSVM